MAAVFHCGDRIGIDPDQGTAGCLMRFKSRPERVLLLTAMHVLVGSRSNRGASVTAADGTPIGTLSCWAGLDGTTTVDAAFVWIDPARLDPTFGPLGALAGVNTAPSKGARLRLVDGRNGTVLDDGAILSVAVSGPDWSEQRDYNNQIICRDFTGARDSGAIAIDDDNRVVGMVVAGGASDAEGGAVTVITPIAAIMDPGLWNGEQLELVTVIPPEAVAPPGLVATAAAGSPFQLAAIDTDRRDTDRAHFHPRMRAALVALEADLLAHAIPLRLFEAFRAPERQQALYAKGRDAAGATVDKRQVVTFAPAWQSYHQYGLAADMVIASPGIDQWESGTAQSQGWWTQYHALAATHGMETLAFEQVHVQLAGLRQADLLAGIYPPDGDDGWAANLDAAITRWPGTSKPPRLSLPDRPPLLAGIAGAAVAGFDWASLPRVQTTGWHDRRGQQWRVDAQGIYLLGVDGGQKPLRTPGDPATCRAALLAFATDIAAAAAKHGVPPELILMTIATETGDAVKQGFTGPATFRWEPGQNDYSAGPMQVLSNTGISLNDHYQLGYAPTDFPPFAAKPTVPPDALPMYHGAISIDLGAAMIRQGIAVTGTDPILVAAAFNHGSLAASAANQWNLLVTGGHLDRASKWFGDACAVLSIFGR